MRVALGLKAHSGWAALVAVAADGGEFYVVERRRMKLVEEAWAKQPYHAAEELEMHEAHEVVKRGVEAARRIARCEMAAARERLHEAGHEVGACAILTSEPMPAWNVDEILAVHFRMHKAEGVLFRDALARAVEACGLKLVEIPEKSLEDRTTDALNKTILLLGKSAGPPWGKDQKDATLAALLALEGDRLKRPAAGPR